jgi:cation transport regulator ChaC/energy-coupling factor transporter ATP-binding protein EcfA2
MHNNSPFNHTHFIGYINQVTPQFVKVHFPSSVLMKAFSFYGEQLKGGLVGNYVVIEGDQFGFLGKILELNLPEKERLELSEKSFNTKEFHPTGKVEILLSFELFNPEKIDKGLNSLPVIGAKVFICSSEFIKGYFRGFGVKEEHKDNAPTIDFGYLTYDKSTEIELSQQSIFSRHCAIVGTTGGGKSYTLSKLIEGVVENKTKTIVIDSTGEYSGHDSSSDSDKPAKLSIDSFFHYTNLAISDLFVLLRPSGQVQAPKLMEAIKSLKVLRILENNIDNDFITKVDENTFSIKINDAKSENIIIRDKSILKANQLMRPFNRVYNKFIGEIESIESNFDIKSLSLQIVKECVYDVDFNDKNKWGGNYPNHLNNCISLILRINNLINNPKFDSLFGFSKKKSDNGELIKKINDFIDSKQKNLLRINFEFVGFDFQSREILSNAIGKYLLEEARIGRFKKQPLILFIDEAHQFLNKKVKDEYFESTDLSTVDSIAKECRKYGLFLCLATQMPRDIPNGTLSQIGTFISHRLINHFDKEAIVNACSSANRETLAFLPVLGAGEAILMGVDFPMPVMLKVKMPTIKPNSSTPLFKLPIMKNKIWVFAYGSLIWNNEEFEPLEIISAKLVGAHRSFNKKSIKSRGTRDKPGLALGLEYGGECKGKAILIYESYLTELKRREGGYLPIETPNDSLEVQDDDGKTMDCLVFLPDSKGENYLNKDVTIKEKAEIIKIGEQGDNGNAKDYLKEIYDFLKEYKIKDKDISDLYELVFGK